MMITSMERRPALSGLHRTESRPSVCLGADHIACEPPDTRDQVASECLSGMPSPVTSPAGAGSPRVTALSVRSHAIQSPEPSTWPAA
jgi:hypothetical protein